MKKMPLNYPVVNTKANIRQLIAYAEHCWHLENKTYIKKNTLQKCKAMQVI